jgi:2-haloacid dehalogenase
MENDHSGKISLLLFDVYGTLLDMSDVKRKVNKYLDSKRGYGFWSETFMHYCLVENATNHNNFTDIARASMKMAAKIFDIDYSRDGFDEILEMLKHLPLHEGVRDGLSLLQDKNYRFVALTNFPGSIVLDRMERTGLISYFEKIFTPEETGKYKPDSAAYHYATKQSGIENEKTLMITSHGWDICGSMHAGLQSAYIERGGEVLYPLSPKSQYTAKDLNDLARQLVK